MSSSRACSIGYVGESDGQSMNLDRSSILKNSFLFVLATLLTALMTAVSTLLVISGLRSKKRVHIRTHKKGFLADKKNALIFYRVFSAAYDILNPQFYTESMRCKIVDSIKGESLRILDVGCGTGYTTQGILDHEGVGEVVGVDINPVQLNRAFKKLHDKSKNLSFSRGDAEDLPFADSTFDAVISVGAIEYFPDPERAILEMSRVVKRGGLVVVGGPEFSWFRKVALDKFFYTPSVIETKYMFSKAGLKDEKSFLLGVETVFGTDCYVIVGTGRKV